MTGRPTHSYSDEQLLRYLEGAVDEQEARLIEDDATDDPELLTRIQALDPWADRLAQTSEALLSLAPESELRQRLGRVTRPEHPEPSPLGKIRSTLHGLRRRPPVRLAYLAAGLLLGVIFTRFWLAPEIELPDDKVPRWVTAAIDHTNLYTLETLSPNPVPRARRLQLLDEAGARAGLDLSALASDMEGFSYQNAWMMEYERQPIVQVLFLHEEKVPLSLFVLRVSDSEAGVEFGEAGIRRGTVDELSVTKWFQPNYEFLAVGRVDPARLDDFTMAVIDRVHER